MTNEFARPRSIKADFMLMTQCFRPYMLFVKNAFKKVLIVSWAELFAGRFVIFACH